MTTFEATTEKLPLIKPRGIYEDKFIDRSPDIRPAGKLTLTSGDTTAKCLRTERRPPSPAMIRRFRDYFRPEPGNERIFYGTAHDEHRAWARDLRHGVIPPVSGSLKKMVNPPPKTAFQQKLVDKKEELSYYNKVAPLGRLRTPDLPEGVDADKTVFGVKTKLDCGAGKIVNPDKTYRQVHEENLVGAELYKKTHGDYDSGEQFTRSYTAPEFNRRAKFGLATPHFVDGRRAKQTLHWLFESNAQKETPLALDRVDHFLEKTQPQLGKTLDPNLDTRQHLSPDHTFGLMLKTDGYGAGDLVHNRIPREFLRGREKERGLVAAIRQNLKKANYQNFHDLLTAFHAYDKDNKGHIDINDLREVCQKYDLPVEPELLEQLLDYCDASQSGVINYIEFANFLNWHDKMPSGLPKKKEDIDTDIVKPEDVETKSPRSRESTPRRLQKQIDKAIGTQKTSASMINAVYPGLPTHEYRSYGVPTIRSDRPAPYIKRIDDTNNYGDESDAKGIVNPSFFAQFGVYEEDLLLPRSKEELLELMTKIGVEISYETLSSIYDKIASCHPKGHVSIETFRSNLDVLALHQIAEREEKLEMSG